MINRKISVHLQDFPNLSFLPQEQDLIESMDLVRAICSSALAIRDDKNLRVRLPLKSLTIIGKNSAKILPFKDIIAEEVNVKNVLTKEEISEFAELKLQINFKKIGAKYGSKIKEITTAAKDGKWQKTSENEVEIAGVKLCDDEFEIKLAVKNAAEKKSAISALPSNDYLVELDIEITKDLEDEGIARDIVRAIQQNRKDADLNVSDQISLKLFSSNPRLLEVARSFENYIKEQVLASEILILEQAFDASQTKYFFENSTEEGDLILGF